MASDRVRRFPDISPEDLAEVEALLDRWLEDEEAGATVEMSVNLNAGRKTKKTPRPWLPRGFAELAHSGPLLILRLVATLHRERARTAEALEGVAR